MNSAINNNTTSITKSIEADIDLASLFDDETETTQTTETIQTQNKEEKMVIEELKVELTEESKVEAVEAKKKNKPAVKSIPVEVHSSSLNEIALQSVSENSVASICKLTNKAAFSKFVSKKVDHMSDNTYRVIGKTTGHTLIKVMVPNELLDVPFGANASDEDNTLAEELIELNQSFIKAVGKLATEAAEAKALKASEKKEETEAEKALKQLKKENKAKEKALKDQIALENTDEEVEIIISTLTDDSQNKENEVTVINTEVNV